jgi:acetyl-CoA carboxylase biotin carboxyl carrier protein
MSETTKSSESSDIFGLSEVRELLRLLGHTDVTELEVEREGARLYIKRGGHTTAGENEPSRVAPVLSASTLAPLGSTAHHPPPHQDDEDAHVELPAGHTVFAPMVGIFYAAPSPKESPFVREGDEVKAGDTLGIIEAMKIMNEIESEVNGRIARILIKNGQSVEYGQPVMVIEPL